MIRITKVRSRRNLTPVLLIMCLWCIVYLLFAAWYISSSTGVQVGYSTDDELEQETPDIEELSHEDAFEDGHDSHLKRHWESREDELDANVQQTVRDYVALDFSSGDSAYVWSAFYDDRTVLPLVRLVTAFPMNFYEWNQLRCEVETEAGHKYRDMEVDFQSFPESPSFSHLGALVTCKIHEGLEHSDLELVKLYMVGYPSKHLPKIPILYMNENKIKHNFTLCSQPMYHEKSFRFFAGQTEADMTIEFLNSLLIFGVTKFVMYDHSAPQLIKRILSFYPEVEMVKLKLPDDFSIHSHGQNLANLDCFYRHMWDSRYITHIDRDELIVPMKNENWGDMVNSILKNNSWCKEFAELNFRCMTIPPSLCSQETMAESHIPNLETDLYWLRCLTGNKNAFPYKVRSKYIINPRRVEFVGVHYVETAVNMLNHDCMRLYVNTDIANLYHKQDYIDDESDAATDERRMLDFSEKLIHMTKERYKVLQDNDVV